MSQPLRSIPTPAGRDFTATTGWSAGGCRIGTQCLRLLPRHAPSLRPGGCTSPRERPDVSTPAFSRSVREPQTRLTPPSTPGTTWPVIGSSARLVLRTVSGSSVSMPPCSLTTLQQRLPAGSPPPSIFWYVFLVPTWHISCAFSLSLTTTVFSQRSTGWFDARPRRPTPEGHTSISRTAPSPKGSYMSPSFNVRDTQSPRNQSLLPLAGDPRSWSCRDAVAARAVPGWLRPPPEPVRLGPWWGTRRRNRPRT